LVVKVCKMSSPSPNFGLTIARYPSDSGCNKQFCMLEQLLQCNNQTIKL
jgi:hypothetical protein